METAVGAERTFFTRPASKKHQTAGHTTGGKKSAVPHFLRENEKESFPPAPLYKEKAREKNK